MTRHAVFAVTLTVVLTGGIASAQGRAPAVTPSATPADPFAAVKGGTQTPQQYQAQYRYMAEIDPLDPFHNWGGNLWNQTWQGQWVAAQRDGRTFEQFWNSRTTRVNVWRWLRYRAMQA